MKVNVWVERSAKTGSFLGYCPEVPGCSATGKSRDEVIRRLVQSLKTQFAVDHHSPPVGVEVVEVNL